MSGFFLCLFRIIVLNSALGFAVGAIAGRQSEQLSKHLFAGQSDTGYPGIRAHSSDTIRRIECIGLMCSLQPFFIPHFSKAADCQKSPKIVRPVNEKVNPETINGTDSEIYAELSRILLAHVECVGDVKNVELKIDYITTHEENWKVIWFRQVIDWTSAPIIFSQMAISPEDKVFSIILWLIDSNGEYADKENWLSNEELIGIAAEQLARSLSNLPKMSWHRGYQNIEPERFNISPNEVFQRQGEAPPHLGRTVSYRGWRAAIDVVSGEVLSSGFVPTDMF